LEGLSLMCRPVEPSGPRPGKSVAAAFVGDRVIVKEKTEPAKKCSSFSHPLLSRTGQKRREGRAPMPVFPAFPGCLRNEGRQGGLYAWRVPTSSTIARPNDAPSVDRTGCILEAAGSAF
jgi:hypothetical protein